MKCTIDYCVKNCCRLCEDKTDCDFVCASVEDPQCIFRETDNNDVDE